MQEINKNIQGLAEVFHDDVVGVRRHMHMHPELSFEEKETSAFIQSKLKALNIPFKSGYAGNGIVAWIEGANASRKIVALRGDMDALPILEQNAVDYASRNEGVMHACGHDVHTASLYGVGGILNKLRKDFEGTVVLIFQPGEERMPGGASIMIEQGALDIKKPAAIFGQHVYPLLPAGKVGFRAGEFMASADELTIRVRGKGGHAAVPHLTVDPIMVTAEILSALQQLISRMNDPVMPSVLSFGKIRSIGGTFNVIPDEVEVLGTFRTFNEAWRKHVHKKLQDIAGGIARGFGATCDVQVTVGYPALINDDELTRRAMDAAMDYLGEENVVELPPRLTAEDFAYFARILPACFYRLGVADPSWDSPRPVHTATFDVDEHALITGPGLMARLALNELKHV